MLQTSFHAYYKARLLEQLPEAEVREWSAL